MVGYFTKYFWYSLFYGSIGINIFVYFLSRHNFWVMVLLTIVLWMGILVGFLEGNHYGKLHLKE